MKTLLPSADLFHLEAMTYQAGRFHLRLRRRSTPAACPSCQTLSRKVHSRYARHLADLPWAGMPVQFDLQVRKFFCRNEACRQQIFCERLPAVALAYARQTVRLNEYLQQCGWQVGGEMSVRLISLAGLQLGADAILQRVRKITVQRTPPKVRVLGVDDFSFRRGTRYGTILIDHERHCVVDLLPSREAKDVADWLRTHPEVEVITRDRAPAYAEGATIGAPQAQQVADRWHLLHNLTEAYKTLLQHHAQELRETVKQLNGGVPTQLPPPAVQSPQVVPPTASEYMRSRSDQARRQAFHTERKACYEQVKQLQAAGLTIVQIAHQLGKSYGGVKTFYDAPDYPVWNRRSPGSQVDRYAEYLQQRWAEGCQNAQQLYREIQAQGYRASALTVRRFLMPWRPRPATTPSASPYARVRFASPRWTAPSASECLWLLLKEETALTAEQQQFRQALLERSTTIRQGRELVREFQQVLAQRNLAAFEAWQARAEESKLKEFAGFLSSLKKDSVAVQNAITQEWSNGATEGHVNRLKNIKRSMFGRAKFDLLKARVING